MVFCIIVIIAIAGDTVWMTEGYGDTAATVTTSKASERGFLQNPGSLIPVKILDFIYQD